MEINKITWAQVGRVAEPGRYMFKFGWLTITPDDLGIWRTYPSAAFTLVKTKAPVDQEVDGTVGEDDFRLGTFDLSILSNYSDGER